MERLQKRILIKDLDKKMVILTGPRQVGKTTLAKSLSTAWAGLEYLNWDSGKDRKVMLRQEWNRKAQLLILDEFHKLKNWKSRIKGVYDTEGIPPRILITGSARLDLYRRGGDSLAGRYFSHRLYPLSVRELNVQLPPRQTLEHLMVLGGFPEPFFSQSEEFSKRWRKQHLERIIREDIQDLEPIKNVSTLFLLVDLLRDRVGSRISYYSLAEDLQVSPNTVKHWIQILEHMYVLFVVTPYHRNLARAILKGPKIYFYDTGAVTGDSGAKLENIIAVSLRKWLHFLEDAKGKDVKLCYVRDKEKREVDFLIEIDRKIDLLIEVKTSDENLSKGLLYFHKKLKPRESLQLVQTAIRTKTAHGIFITPAADWLTTLDA
ncbi:MAG: ATP-binding protein [Candidatus Omnitrophota bacterium]|nr:ATP-binding protein [Candidatus Omnitrophota bacterium]